jgi:hypothetical protein
MSKLQNMRAIEIKNFRAVSSGWKTSAELWGDDGFQSAWVNQNQHLLVQHMYEPTCFLWHDDITVPADQIKNTYILAVKDDVTPKDTEPYEIIDFPGGMFLVATADELDSDDLNETVDCMFKWINDSDVFEYGDFPKSGMCNMPNPDGVIDKALSIAQQQIYLPLKFRVK